MISKIIALILPIITIAFTIIVLLNAETTSQLVLGLIVFSFVDFLTIGCAIVAFTKH